MVSEIRSALAVATVCAAATCIGATHRVVPDEASKSVPGWESASTDLKGTIESARDGEVVLVMNGHYDISQEIAVQRGTVTIRSVNPTTGETDLGGAIFDARKNDPTRETRILKSKNNLHVYGCQFINAHLSSGVYDSDAGAALFMGDWESVYVNDCIFSNNYTKCCGAAIGCTWGTYPSLYASNTVFACNEAIDTTDRKSGGAVALFHGQKTTFTDCHFFGNVARDGTSNRNGAAAGCYSGAIRLFGCTFEGNVGNTVVLEAEGGVLANCVFRNHATVASAIAMGFALSNCLFTANSCTALLAGTGSSPVCQNTVITNNTASYLIVNNHSLTFRNCLIADNNFGTGRLFHTHPGWPSRTYLENCTLTRNTAKDFWYDSGNKEATSGMAITNCVIWGNSFGTTSIAATVPQFGAYNCSDYAFIQGLTDADTRWTDSPELSGASGYLGRMSELSPYLERGAKLDWMTEDAIDLAGDPRVIGAKPALGCYEKPVSWMIGAKRVVPDEASKSVPGWENASTDLKGTIEGAQAGETVCLMNGHYDVAAEIVVAAKNVTIRSVNPATEVTDFGGAIFDARKGDATREIRILKAKDGLCVVGCQFVNGHLTLDKYDSADAVGAGVLLDVYGGSKAYFTDCVFSNNSAKCYGAAVGGAWGKYPSVIAKNCLFAGNQTEQSGTTAGGAFGAFNGMSSSFTDCVFTNNVSTGGTGAALGALYGGVTVRGCTFVANVGATIVRSGSADGLVADCLFVKNETTGAVSDGGATLSNCVFTANNSESLVSGTASRPLCWNTVFTNNVLTYFIGNTHALRYRNCLIAGNTMDNAMLRTHFQWPTANSFENCTIVNNTAQYLWWDWKSDSPSSGLVMTNTILWGNTFSQAPVVGSDAVTKEASNVCTDDSFVQGFADADTLLKTAPRFLSAANGDYRIRPGSKCREYGVKTDWMTPDAVDLGGQARLANRLGVANAPDARPDLGCYESQERAPGCLLLVR